MRQMNLYWPLWSPDRQPSIVSLLRELFLLLVESVNPIRFCVSDVIRSVLYRACTSISAGLFVSVEISRIRAWMSLHIPPTQKMAAEQRCNFSYTLSTFSYLTLYKISSWEHLAFSSKLHASPHKLATTLASYTTYPTTAHQALGLTRGI